MNIGQAASASGVSAKLIRYYEQIGLVRPAARTGSNYRNFGPAQIGELTFIKRARTLGFSIEEIVELMALWRDHERSLGERRSIADRYIAELQTRVVELGALSDTLRELSRRLADGGDPDLAKLFDPPWRDGQG